MGQRASTRKIDLEKYQRPIFLSEIDAKYLNEDYHEEFKSTLKVVYTMIKWDLTRGPDNCQKYF